MENFEVIHEGGKPIKAWIKGVPLEDVARQQLINTAALPFIHKHIAVMPDVHWGMGATIGSVIPTKGAIIPAAVGVDIGCGMMAMQTTLRADQLPDNLLTVRSDIEAAVPHGRTDNGGKNDRGAWGELPPSAEERWKRMAPRYKAITETHPKAKAFNTGRHMGTLGTGNHFIEVCLDEADQVWVMLHSGSRGCGNRIGTYFIQAAKKEMERWFINLPDKDLAYLVEGSELFKDYIDAVEWAQDYALENRKEIMAAVLGAMRKTLPEFAVTDMAVNCHHNYVARENHFGANVWLTRKGAVRAREGDLGIIPGSMGVRSYIVRGKGNAESFHSCSHGAGRAMSRGKAKKQFSLEDHAKATEGVECRKDEGVIDETPGAYKDIDAVMAAQTDLVEVVHTLKQVVCVKG
ncbi:MAG: RtcB family protein [Proteobacteria bacterium]|nr:RtcB family protein [Pseudomonadota bacterium]